MGYQRAYILGLVKEMKSSAQAEELVLVRNAVSWPQVAVGVWGISVQM